MDNLAFHEDAVDKDVKLENYKTVQNDGDPPPYDNATSGNSNEDYKEKSSSVPPMDSDRVVEIEMGVRRRKRSKEEGGEEGPKEEEEDYSIFTFIPNYKEYRRRYTDWKKGPWPKTLVLSLLVFFYVVYFLTVMTLVSPIEKDDYWCRGDGFLLVLTLLASLMLVYFQVVKKYFGMKIYKSVLKPFKNFFDDQFDKRPIRYGFYGILVISLVIFLVVDTASNRARLQSVTGVFVLLGLGFIFSAAPRKVIWRQVVWGMALQFIMGLMILRLPVGKAVFSCAGDKISALLSFTDQGSKFVFGHLIGSETNNPVFAFFVLPVILFFSFLIQILYFYGVMQWVVIKIGWLLQVTVGTTACESVNAAANVFLGMTEAPLMIKPFLPIMTKSELHAVLTGGFATIAGSVMAAYISFGINASHLLSASVMSAPAALAYSKLFYPETEESKTKAGDIPVVQGTEVNALHAAIEGVTAAIPLVANICANLIAFIAFIAFFNAVFNWSCMLINIDDGVCTLENISGYVFMPLAWTMGVEWADCRKVGTLIGIKTIVNEFVAYKSLSNMVEAGELSLRSEIIATYALCGFSNISSIGSQMGSIGALAPERRSDIAKIIVRAMIAGSAACFLTGCIAGTLLDDNSLREDLNRTFTN